MFTLPNNAWNNNRMQVIFHSIQSADTCDEDASQIQNT